MRSTSRMMCCLRNAGGFLLALFIGGCAVLSASTGGTSPPRDALSAFSLEGRFSLRHENKNYSGNLSWRHVDEHNTLVLSSPFGQGMAEINTSESGAQLTTNDGKTYVAANAETLTQQVLGYPLPLAQLADWVRGQGAKAGIAQRDVYGRLLQLRHESWRIDYGYGSDEPQAPPNRIFAENASGLELRLLINEWTSLPPGEWKP